MSEDKIPKKVIAAIVATGIMSFCGVIVETLMNIAFPTLMRQFNISTNTDLDVPLSDFHCGALISSIKEQLQDKKAVFSRQYLIPNWLNH